MSIKYDVQPNSHKYKKEQKLKEGSSDNNQKNINSVVTNGARTKKKNELTKIAEIVNANDIRDTLVSTSKKAVSDLIMKAVDIAGDVVKNCIDIALYGEPQTRKKSGIASKTSYERYYDKPITKTRTTGVRNIFDYDDVIFETRGDAELVLDAMYDIIDQYGIVSVGDLYELSEVSTTNYMVNNYGWKDIQGATIVRGREGYMIKLPRAVPVNGL